MHEVGASAMGAADDSQRLEAQLVQRCLTGDARAFGSLAERYYRPIGAFLLRRVQRSDVVEDLAQDTFLEAFAALKTGRGPQHFSSWLFGIAHNIAGKWLRRKRPALFDPAEVPGTPAVEPEILVLQEEEEHTRRLAALDAGLAGLPGEVRQILELKHRHGRTCEQIAAQTGRPVGTIKSLLSRAYATLRDRLGPAEEGRS
jgi:RNA polymerase sigma-70 factor (ECF subfamily)